MRASLASSKTSILVYKSDAEWEGYEKQAREGTQPIPAQNSCYSWNSNQFALHMHTNITIHQMKSNLTLWTPCEVDQEFLIS